MSRQHYNSIPGGGSDNRNNSEEEDERLPQLPQQSHPPYAGMNQYQPQTQFDNSSSGYSTPQYPDITGGTQNSFNNSIASSSHFQQYPGGRIPPQPTTSYNDSYIGDVTNTHSSIPLQTLDIPNPRPLPQEPVFNNLHANTSHISGYSQDPFHENPFETNNYDDPITQALNANNSNLNIPTQNTGYGGSSTSLNPDHAYNSYLDNDFNDSGIQINTAGDSYMVNPVDSGVMFYDSNMNPIRMGAAPQSTGASTPTNMFAQGGVTVSQNVGRPINREELAIIEGRPIGFDDGESEYARIQKEKEEEEEGAINEDALFLGNLTLDCTIPQSLSKAYKIGTKGNDRSGSEFSQMRYTAVTCEPSRFLFNRFTLRQQLFKRPRTPCDMMIVVTMYNEEDILLGRTLKGVFDNIKYLCKHNKDPDAWKSIVVAVVSDGRSKINPRSRALMASLGCYQEGFAQESVLGKETTCHLYEHTTLANIKSVTDTVNFEYDDIVPVQMIFALKEKNQKKINSHRWCFQALAPVLEPTVIVLLDAGTEPTKKSIFKLWREFDENPNVGGACGEIKAMLGSKLRNLWSGFFSGLLVAGQNFEYKMSNILDKPTESVFGFISVLPGAFSAYRFEALKNDAIGEGPLAAYFKGETLHNSEGKHDLFANNMYLAEDRILCFEIVTKKNSKWVLRYVNTAAAATDVPDSLPEFISQRRRWLNGSFFAAIYSVVHFGKIYRSSHSFGRKIALQTEFVYNTINIIISWFSVGSFFLVFRILTLSVSTEDGFMDFKPGKVIAVILLWIYIVCTLSVFIFAFGNKPKGTKAGYWTVTICYAVMMGYMIFCAVWLSIKSIRVVIKDASGSVGFSDFAKNANFRDLVISIASTYVLYIVSSCLYGQPWHMITSFAQYMLLSPMYINVLNIYAFCNIHDISWGTKGDDGSGGGAKQIKKVQDGKVMIDVPTDPEKVEELYQKEQQLVKTVYSSQDENQPVNKKEEKGDYYQFVRSMVVLSWCITNGALIAVVLNVGGAPKSKTVSDDDPTAGTNATTYLTVILWLVAVLAGFRFIGSMIYLFSRIRLFKSRR